VDNSVDGFPVDPISTAIAWQKHHWSFFVHIDKKPVKQGFAREMRMCPQNPLQHRRGAHPLCISFQSKGHKRVKWVLERCRNHALTLILA
jgi:hypothetical protein